MFEFYYSDRCSETNLQLAIAVDIDRRHRQGKKSTSFPLPLCLSFSSRSAPRKAALTSVHSTTKDPSDRSTLRGTTKCPHRTKIGRRRATMCRRPPLVKESLVSLTEKKIAIEIPGIISRKGLCHSRGAALMTIAHSMSQ